MIETAALGLPGRAAFITCRLRRPQTSRLPQRLFLSGPTSRPAHSLSTLRDHGHPCTSLRSRKTRFRRGGLRRRRWDSHPGSLTEVSGCYLLPLRPGLSWRTVDPILWRLRSGNLL